MKLTEPQIMARKRLYNAFVDNRGVTFTEKEVGYLWGSILTTGKELSQKNDTLREIADLAFGGKDA